VSDRTDAHAATIRRQQSGYAFLAAWRNEKLFRDPPQPTRELQVLINDFEHV
jgi:hypothetical protein